MSDGPSPEEIERHDALCQSIGRTLETHDASLDESLMALVSVMGHLCALAPNPEAVCLAVVGELVEEFQSEKQRLGSDLHVTIPAPPDTSDN